MSCQSLRNLYTGIYLGWEMWAPPGRTLSQTKYGYRWLTRDNLESNPVTITPETMSHDVVEQFFWIILPYCSLPRWWWRCSVAKSGPTLCDPMDCSTPSLPVPHYLPEFAQVHVHWVSDAIHLALCQVLLSNKVFCFISTCVSSYSSFLSIEQEPTLWPWKGSPFLQHSHSR